MYLQYGTMFMENKSVYTWAHVGHSCRSRVTCIYLLAHSPRMEEHVRVCRCLTV